MRIDPQPILQQIMSLQATHPEIWEDGEEQLLADCLEAETDIDDFLKLLIDRLHEAEAFAGGIATRIAELELRQERYEKREKAFRNLIFKVMDFAGLRKRELPEATLSIRPVPPSVLITNEEWLPDIACKFERKPDKTKIKELLQTGPVAGACMSNGSTTLSIRTR